MRSISVYDTDADKIEKICEDKDITSMELIQVFLEILDYYEDLDLDQWL